VAEPDPTPDELRALQEQLAALSVEQFLVSAASTLAALGTAKLEAKDLPEAKRAIDALASVVTHLEGEFARELRQALTTLQVAFAGAASA
jgi:hypothetical protein